MSSSALTETGSRRLHPATEIIVLGCALVLVFGIPSPVIPLIVLVGSAVAAVASPTVKVTTWAATVAALCVPMLIVVGLVQGLFYPGAEVHVLWQAGPVRLSVEGLAIAVQLWSRVTALVALCAVIGLGGDAARLFDGLIALGLPASIAYVCASSLNLIPLVRGRVRTVLDARAPAAGLSTAGPCASAWPPGIVTGLFTSLLVTVDQRHEVLDQRGFAASDHSVSLQDHSDSHWQRLLRRGGPVLTLILIVLSVIGLLPLPGAEEMLGGLR
ncbi:energy-coupling factor transporter transmembrane protein EcfT [Brevibacterium casei]|nr:energy-coupling factor transporter transmembrane protein EcfT [Brevibacterium casei]